MSSYLFQLGLPGAPGRLSGNDNNLTRYCYVLPQELSGNQGASNSTTLQIIIPNLPIPSLFFFPHLSSIHVLILYNSDGFFSSSTPSGVSCCSTPPPPTSNFQTQNLNHCLLIDQWRYEKFKGETDEIIYVRFNPTCQRALIDCSSLEKPLGRADIQAVMAYFFVSSLSFFCFLFFFISVPGVCS